MNSIRLIHYLLLDLSLDGLSFLVFADGTVVLGPLSGIV